VCRRNPSGTHLQLCVITKKNYLQNALTEMIFERNMHSWDRRDLIFGGESPPGRKTIGIRRGARILFAGAVQSISKLSRITKNANTDGGQLHAWTAPMRRAQYSKLQGNEGGRATLKSSESSERGGLGRQRRSLERSKSGLGKRHVKKREWRRHFL